MEQVFVVLVWLTYAAAFRYLYVSTRRKVREALSFVADPSSVLRETGRVRELSFANSDPRFPCAISAKKSPKDAARVAIARSQDSLLIVDPFGSDDVAISMGQAWLHEFLDFAWITGLYTEQPVRRDGRRARRKRLQVVFKREYVTLLPAPRKPVRWWRIRRRLV